MTPSSSAARPCSRAWLALFALTAFPCACRSAGEQRAAADRDVYAILEQRRLALGLGQAGFTIEPPADSLRQRLLAGERPGSMGLVQTLTVAAENSRDYQRRKEDLYLTALDLTLERFRFQVQRNGSLGAALAGDGDGASSAGGDVSTGFSKVLGTGAAIVGNLGLSIARDLSSGDGWDLVSDLSLNITQPLLRGFGKRIVMERLTLAEREVVYEVRSFERFRRTFAIDITSRYFAILRQVDTVANERLNMDNLRELRERNEALSQAGRLSDIQVDQALQNELSSKNRLIAEEARLATALDDFKLFLGLPIETEILLDMGELENLARADESRIDEARAIEIGLAERLDYLTALDALDDSARNVEIAADNLRSSLDVVADIGALSAEGRPLDYSSADVSWTLSARLDLPIDVLAERNAYRSALIALERSRRAADELADSIRSDLRADLRQESTQLETLQIQDGSVALAERRVESTNLNRDAGRADTRDILEAQDALRSARNALTAARIEYHMSRLQLWRDMELVRVDQDGIGVDRERLDAPTEELP